MFCDLIKWLLCLKLINLVVHYISTEILLAMYTHIHRAHTCTSTHAQMRLCIHTHISSPCLQKGCKVHDVAWRPATCTHTTHTSHVHKHTHTCTHRHTLASLSLCYARHTTQRLLHEWSTSSPPSLTCSPAHSPWLDHIPSPKHPIRPYNWHMQFHTWMETAYNTHTHTHVCTYCTCLYIIYTYMYTLFRKLATKWIV